ncbi:hypothetical protein [Streptacidiphilus rugosus]|uniref:hypothetical protein n=1 Tax=Streptacidiphilus rugosus TaxID=405783 RepID=UPI00055B4625|nr:hypothetical protein [Streptacidiphilus rugosus]
MPFAPQETRISLACGRDPDGRPRGWYGVEVRETVLRRFGLHPDQPTSRPAEPRPPRRWYTMAAARRQPRKGRRYP